MTWWDSRKNIGRTLHLWAGNGWGQKKRDVKREDPWRSPSIVSGFGGKCECEKMLREDLSPERAAGQGPLAETARNPLPLTLNTRSELSLEAPEKRPACPASWFCFGNPSRVPGHSTGSRGLRTVSCSKALNWWWSVIDREKEHRAGLGITRRLPWARGGQWEPGSPILPETSLLRNRSPMLLEEGLVKPFCCTQIMGNTYRVSQEEKQEKKKTLSPWARSRHRTWAQAFSTSYCYQNTSPCPQHTMRQTIPKCQEFGTEEVLFQSHVRR